VSHFEGRPPRTNAAAALCFFHQAALSVWVGGILVLGAIAAPAIFGTARASGATERGMPLFDFAGTAMGAAFERFSVLAVVLGGVVLVAGVGYGRLSDLCPVRLRVRGVLTALAWIGALVLAKKIIPEMNAARAGSDAGQFDQLHHLSSFCFQAQALLLLAVTGLTGWLHLDR
jgi:uncharacterized membrane protein